ncbi:7518_t:CDS:1 [Ambispora leptoticha]|uniref:7518_t:CDS:1 n=1 Tax=Ambispora leptoticha TaxID=144679 RepID=A0A9N9NJY9_9GLOM|nr:7518_t:CDS:1 [Ambispora leptoticha]
MSNIIAIAQLQADLTSINPVLVTPTPCPFTDGRDVCTKATIAHHQMMRAIQTRDRIESLVHAYYLGSILDIASRNQLTNLRNVISRHYFIGATRTYYLFERFGVEQLYRTSYTTLNMVRLLTNDDFQSLLQ